jgi:NAD+ diphosphatase
MPFRTFPDGSGLDRAAHRRTDQAWLEARLRDPDTRILAVRDSRLLMTQAESPEPAFLCPADLPPALVRGRGLVFLGLTESGIAYFAADLSGPAESAAPPPIPPGAAFADLGEIGPLLKPRAGATLAYAKGMIHWHGQHRFCSCCGAPSEAAQAGHLRVCTGASCGAHHFPRMDPAVIVLVSDGERALLGRQRSWRPGLYSTLAGFVEPGESLEEAVAREVFEETGVKVNRPRYRASQPWPFPASLMLGFRAEARTNEICRDELELEDVRWFSRQAIRARSGDAALRIPGRHTIARALIEDWLGEG